MEPAKIIRSGRFSILALCSIAVLLIVVAGMVYFGAGTRNLVSKDVEWKITGKFVRQGVYPSTKFDARVNHAVVNDTVFWGSWAGDDRNTGELVSPSFHAPSILEMFVAGYPTQPKNGIFLERDDTHDRMPLRIPELFVPREQWEELQWILPSSWREKSVRLIAVDGETGSWGWLGVSSPRAINWAELAKQQLPAASIILLLYVLNLGLFLLPGFALAMLIASRREVCVIHLVILTALASAALGYLAFWAYFESKLLGKMFCVSLVSIAVLILAVTLTRSAQQRSVNRHVVVPFLYVLVVGICYLCLFFVFGNPFPSRQRLANIRFFDNIRPGDNVIPLIFAEKIFHRQPIEPFCCGDWLSSDRPPLQAGIFLFQRTLKVFPDVDLNYQTLATALQCLWLCGVWCFLKALRAPPYRVRQVLGFMVLSGFFFENSVYVWPKLLAASFILFGLSILLDLWVKNEPIGSFETVLVAMSFSLAALAHPGSIFSLPVFLLILISKRGLVSVRQCALGLILIGLSVAPWIAYQKFYDPPGNRLLKMHLAGSSQIDSRSTWQALKDAYTRLDIRTYFAFKWANISKLIGPKPVDSFGLTSIHLAHGLQLDRKRLQRVRLTQGTYIWNAVGVVNAGWLAMLVFFLRRKKEPALKHSGFIMLAVLVNLLVWSLVMFGPGQTITATSSYADIILLFIGLCSFLLVLPRLAVVFLFGLQILNFFVVWVFSPPDNLNLQSAAGIGPTLQWPLLVMGLSCALGLAWHFGRSYFQQGEPNS